jgi:type I restriction enzyme S subunit
MANNKQIPEIRFSGFTDAWEQRKLGELAEFSKGQGYTKSDLRESGIPIILYGRLYTKYQPIIREVDTFADATPQAVFSKGGEVILPSSGETAEDIAIAASVDKSGFLLGGGLNIVLPHKEIDSAFLAIEISFGTPHTELAKRAQGKSVVHLYNEDLKAVEISYPTIAEQKQISTLFDSFDNLITLHQRECDKLMITKKSMLKKMFPKNNEVVPEIRFSGFTDAWEQRKLGEISEIVGGGTPSTSIAEYWDGDIDWYAPAEIGEQIYVNSSKKKITKAGLENSSAKILPIGTILFTSRAGIGNTAILAKNGATNQGFQSIIPIQNVLDTYFLFSMTNQLKRYGEITGAGSTFVEVSGKQMAKMELMLPSYNEQQQIGAFFKNLDDLITLHQRELEKLNNIKKSMLEKMFV